MNYEELLIAYNKLKNENILLKTEIEHLRNPHSNSKNLFINPDENTLQQPISLPKVHIGSKPDEKMELFMTLFHGRTDVYARRWYNEKNNNAGYKPVCENEWRHGLCDMKKHKCTNCPNRKLLPLDKLTIAAHLRGENKFCKDVIGIYSLIAENEIRNRHIINDVLKCLNAGRNPIILTGRSAHVTKLSNMLKPNCPNVIMLIGSTSQKEKREALKHLNEVSKDEPMIIVATGKYVGEGFDCPRLDTLFMAMPVAWKGTVAQYAGRLHRQYEGKNEVVIYDYIDIQVPVLEKMYHKRVRGYAQIGYKSMPQSDISEKTNTIFDESNFQSVLFNDFSTARKEIIIVSPFMKPARVKQMIQQISYAAASGITITIVTRPPENFTGETCKTIHELTKLLNSANIKVIFKSKMHQKYAIIDQKIVWYGSLNFLSYGFGEENLMRFENYEIADELLGIL